MVLGPQLPGNRTEDARSDGLGLLVDDHRGVAVEPDQRAVLALDRRRGAYDNRFEHVPLLDAAAGNGLLDRDHDPVADPGVAPLRPAQHLDAHDPARARIVGDFEIGLHLDHGGGPSSP